MRKKRTAVVTGLWGAVLCIDDSHLADGMSAGTIAATARLMEQRLDDLGLLGWELCDEMKES